MKKHITTKIIVTLMGMFLITAINFIPIHSADLILEPPSILRDFTSDGHYFSVGNQLYASNQSMVLDQRITTPDYIQFNTTGFYVTAPDSINISLVFINSDIAGATTGDKVLEFWANTTSGNVWFNLSGFSSGANYTVNKSGATISTPMANSTGYISFNNSAWSEHLFEIYQLEAGPPSAICPSNKTDEYEDIQIQFDASASTNCETYKWDWTNDGVYDNTTINPLINHIYETPANYTIKLQVNNSENITDNDTMFCLVKYNLTKNLSSGSNFIAVFQPINASVLSDGTDNSQAVLFWNSSSQEYSSSYIPSFSDPIDSENHDFEAGNNTIISVSANSSVQLKGFYPQSSRSLVTDDNWIGRTDDDNISGIGNDINASSVSSLLSHCSAILFWNATSQQFSSSYIPGFSDPTDPENFNITAGTAICVTMLENETLNQYGW